MDGDQTLKAILRRVYSLPSEVPRRRVGGYGHARRRLRRRGECDIDTANCAATAAATTTAAATAATTATATATAGPGKCRFGLLSGGWFAGGECASYARVAVACRSIGT